MKLLPLTALSIAVLGASLAHAAAPHVVGTWSVFPSPTALATADGRVFAIDRSDLTVFDPLATVASPGERVTLPRRPTDLAFLRSIAFEPETSLHRVAERVYVTTASNDAELVAIAVQPGEAPAIERVVDLPGLADALCVTARDGLVVTGRRRSSEHEIVVLGPDGTVLGGLDLPQSIRTIEASSGVVRASSTRWTYLVDVAVPAQPTLLATVPREASPLAPLAVARTADFVIDGPMAWFATRTRDAGLQAVDLDLPFSFADADSDGVWRLGCLGDSNTDPHTSMTRWCEKLASLIDDPRFAIVNFAVAGATAIATDNDASTQVAAALDPDLHLDAAILAFGTNDTNLVWFSPDPALFGTQITAIADAIEQHAATLRAAGVAVFVATTPPRWKALFGPDGFNDRIVALNAAVRARVPEASLIDFYEGFHPDASELADGVHLNQRGQDKRAWRALGVLRR